MKLEHKIIILEHDTTYKEREKILNDLSDAGWELTNIIHKDITCITEYYFKRTKQLLTEQL